MAPSVPIPTPREGQAHVIPEWNSQDGVPSALTTWTLPSLSTKAIRPSSRMAEDCSTSLGGATDHFTEPFGLMAQNRFGKADAMYIVPSSPTDGLPSVSWP